jgi:uncharacterized protein YjbI with pentapeptide repeats
MTNEELTAILAAHIVWVETRSRDGQRADFRGAKLEDVVLDGANLAEADFSGASLRGVGFVNANLMAADFTKCSMESVVFSGANLTRASFRKSKGKIVVFEGADLSFANFEQCELPNVDFYSSRCSGTKFRAANLSESNFKRALIEDAYFERADISYCAFSEAKIVNSLFHDTSGEEANFSETELKVVDFYAAELKGAEFSLARGKADFRDTNLAYARFDRAKLILSNFYGAKLVYARFDGADVSYVSFDTADMSFSGMERVNAEASTFRGTKLQRARLSGSSFAGVVMTEADLEQASGGDQVSFKDADLRSSNFRNAHLLRSNFAGSDCRGANFFRADLREASFSRSKLQNAYFDEAVLTRSRFNEANLEGASFKDAKVKDIDLEEAVGIEDAIWKGTLLEFEFVAGSGTLALGKKTRVVSKLKKQALPMKAGAFKKLFPQEFEQIKAETQGADFTPELLDRIVAKHGVTWRVTSSRYHGSAQRICDVANKVLQLNVDLDDPVYTDEQRSILRQVKEVSIRSGHPVKTGKRWFTIGWVRYCEFFDRFLVEEVQSDVGGVRKGLKDPEFRSQLQSRGLEPEDIEQALALMQPFADRFYEDALGLTFDLAEEHGMKVEMLDYAQKKEHGSPRNVYTDLPKSMGMKLAPSLALPELGQVWTYTPNRRTRRR